MKKAALCLFFFSFVFPLFSADFTLTALEKRIIKANSKEMASIVQDRGLEKQLLAVFMRYEDEAVELEDVYPAFLKENPSATEADIQSMILKVGMVSALGSGKFDTVQEGLELVGFLKEIDASIKQAEITGNNTEELNSLKNSRYWQDCVAFANSFDQETFMAQRFPGN
jgi:hypothetical protein